MIEMPSIDPEMTDWLAKTSFEELFLRGDEPRHLGHPETLDRLAAIACSPGLSPKIRVLAHELLIEAGRQPNQELAETYCRALPETFSHNAWGMPGRYTERLGKTVVAFGKPALPCLLKLFTDQRPLGYFGSEEPTLSRSMRYRVCDLAAYLASLVVGVTFRNSLDPETRDSFISQLAMNLSG
jgi:hypothetical protein